MEHHQTPFDAAGAVDLDHLPDSVNKRRAVDHVPRRDLRATGLGGLLNRFGLGRSTSETETAERAESACRLDATTTRIMLFLQQYGLDPTPDHFLIGWTYFVSPLSGLSLAIDKVIVRDGRLTEASAALLLSEHRASNVANDLAGLLLQAKEGIADGSKVVRQSRDDVAAFGNALRTELGTTSDDPDPDPRALMSLTEAMVQKALEAERELRSVSGELAKMEKRVRAAERLAETDPLTGLPNRRAFTDALEQAIARARTKAKPLSVAFCDIDHFKLINDTHGHATGDRVLKYVAGMLSAAANGNCHVARHGGEEFVMLFKDQSTETAHAIVDSVREALAKKRLVAMDTEQPIGTVTFSAGIAAMDAGSTAGGLLHEADLALYRAKHTGRNQVCF